MKRNIILSIGLILSCCNNIFAIKLQDFEIKFLLQLHTYASEQSQKANLRELFHIYRILNKGYKILAEILVNNNGYSIDEEAGTLVKQPIKYTSDGFLKLLEEYDPCDANRRKVCKELLTYYNQLTSFEQKSVDFFFSNVIPMPMRTFIEIYGDKNDLVTFDKSHICESYVSSEKVTGSSCTSQPEMKRSWRKTASTKLRTTGEMKKFSFEEFSEIFISYCTLDNFTTLLDMFAKLTPDEQNSMQHLMSIALDLLVSVQANKEELHYFLSKYKSKIESLSIPGSQECLRALEQKFFSSENDLPFI